MAAWLPRVRSPGKVCGADAAATELLLLSFAGFVNRDSSLSKPTWRIMGLSK